MCSKKLNIKLLGSFREMLVKTHCMQGDGHKDTTTISKEQPRALTLSRQVERDVEEGLKHSLYRPFYSFQIPSLALVKKLKTHFI